MIKENNASEAKDEQQNKYYHICHVDYAKYKHTSSFLEPFTVAHPSLPWQLGHWIG